MVAGHHLVWTAYGWWLPNDPRGSMSEEIRVEPIGELGPAHYGRKKWQPRYAAVRTVRARAAPRAPQPYCSEIVSLVSLYANRFPNLAQRTKVLNVFS